MSIKGLNFEFRFDYLYCYVYNCLGFTALSCSVPKCQYWMCDDLVLL